MGETILVAEDEAVSRKNVCRVLRDEGYQVHEAEDGKKAIEALETLACDLVLTDLKMPGADGLAVLKQVRELSPQTLVILMTAHGSVETAVEALHLGAQDYILKPLILEDVLRKVRLLLEYKSLAWENQVLRREVSQFFDAAQLVGRSQAVQRLAGLIEKVALVSATVLITGESGVGKEVVARMIHGNSPRQDKVFLQLNCSAIPETLLESQLFGYMKGAFPGASTAQEGLFQGAQGGSLFLDEIGELPLTLQPKVLQVLEAKEVLPLGATKPVRVDVRILAATNRDLEHEVEAGRFREDLYYRLNVVGIHVPPLRERREDIPLLVEHLIRRHNQQMKTMYKGVDRAAMKILMALSWKGNIRELDNALERAMIFGSGEWITPADLPYWEDAPQRGQGLAVSSDLKEALRVYERVHIENVLKGTAGDRTRAAELLGLSRSSLYRKIEKLGIALD